MTRWKRGEEFTAENVVRNHKWWTRPVGWLIARVYLNTKIIGREYIRAEGPALIASNHTGIADGPLVHFAVPRNSNIMTKMGMMTSRLGGFLRAAGQFPVDRKGGRRALQISLTLLKEGRVVVIFPEGGRGGGTGDGIKAGVAWLAQHSGAPVIPTACLGTRPTGASVGHIPGFRATPHVVFGPAITLPADLPPGREGTARAMRIIEEGLERHIAATVASTGIPLPTDAGERDGFDIGRTTE